MTLIAEKLVAYFQRRLPDDASTRARKLASGSTWMSDLLAEWAPSGSCGSLRLAIRNGYLNFYHLGQSVSKVDFPERKETATSTIHHKYIDPTAKGQKYRRIGPYKGLDETGVCCEWGGPAMLASWISKAGGHANREKKHIDALLNVSPKVIDLEIALPARPGGERSAPRIDIASLEEPRTGASARLVFWEVKMIDDARLRSRSVPKVVEQIKAYEDYVRHDPGLFEDAYRKTCRILGNFHDIASRLWEAPRPLDPLVSATADGGPVEVDPEPRLLIIDDGSSPGGNWQHHLTNLTSGLPGRVHLARAGQTDPIEAAPRVPRQST